MKKADNLLYEALEQLAIIKAGVDSAAETMDASPQWWEKFDNAITAATENVTALHKVATNGE